MPSSVLAAAMTGSGDDSERVKEELVKTIYVSCTEAFSFTDS